MNKIRKVLVLTSIVWAIVVVIPWLNEQEANAGQRRPAKEQFEYAISLYEEGFQFFVKFARDKQKEYLPIYVEKYQQAIREHGKVFGYPDDVEYCHKAAPKIDQIISDLLKAGVYQASLNGEENYPPYDGRFVDIIIEEYRQTIQQYPGTEEAAIAEYMIGLIYGNLGYQRWEGSGLLSKKIQFQKIVNNYPQSKLVPLTHIEVGHCCGDIEAIPIYQEVTQKYPNTIYASIAQMCIGTEYENKGYWDENPEYYRKAIEEITKVIIGMPNIEYWDSDTHAWAREEIKSILSEVAFPAPYTHEPKVVFPAKIQLQPDKWNIEWLKEHPGEGQINCYIGNIGTYTVEEIDTSWIRLNATVA
ncbi:hypothetical protein KJ640_03900, partial [bacterium]|nr:hypothetical protein [bacterium]